MQIITGRRLHFGLYSPIAVPELDLIYGGLGIMVDATGVHLSAEMASSWVFEGNQADRVQQLVSELIKYHPHQPPLHFHVEYQAPAHQGWGTGTQLVMAVITLLRGMAPSHMSDSSPEELAQKLGRGKRSHIGITGFNQGGLLLDSGKRRTDTQGTSVAVQSVIFPPSWTFVLIEPEAENGLYAESERRAFSSIQAVDYKIVHELKLLAEQVLIPAAVQEDFHTFASHLTRYNYLAGTHYQQVQGGHYSSPKIASRIAHLQHLGAVGVGQSSWGPGLFALFPAGDAANDFIARHPLPGCRMTIAHVQTSQPTCFIDPG